MKITNIKYLSKFLIYMIIINGLLFCDSYAVENQILRKPWLQGVETDKVIIMVETKSKNTIEILFKEKYEVEWQKVKSSFSVPTENYNSYVHRVIIDSLKQGVEYKYKVEETIYNYRHPDFSDCLIIANMGDNRSGYKKWNKISQLMRERKPDLSIFNGDLAYKNDYKYWENEFFSENASNFISEIPFYNATGNHEGWKVNTKLWSQQRQSGHRRRHRHRGGEAVG